MKRTKFPLKKKPSQQPIPVNLIRSIAWTFYKSSKVNWDELFSEACLAYCESLQKYDPSKGSSQTTWAYIAMKNALINFCKREHQNSNPTGVEELAVDSYEPSFEVFQDPENYTEELEDLEKAKRIIELRITRLKDVNFIVRLVKQNPQDYGSDITKQFGNLWRDLLTKEGWSWIRIWQGMRDLKSELISS